MKLQDGQVLFDSYSNWYELLAWLKKKGKRLIVGTTHTYIKTGQGMALALPVEDIPKNPPKPKLYSCEVNNVVSAYSCLGKPSGSQSAVLLSQLRSEE